LGQAVNVEIKSKHPKSSMVPNNDAHDLSLFGLFEAIAALNRCNPGTAVSHSKDALLGVAGHFNLKSHSISPVRNSGVHELPCELLTIDFGGEKCDMKSSAQQDRIYLSCANVKSGIIVLLCANVVKCVAKIT